MTDTTMAEAPPRGKRTTGVRTRRRARLPVPDWAISAAILVAGIVLVELACRNGLVSALIIPAPSQVWVALVDGFDTGILWPHLTSTLVATGIGFAISIVVGISLGGALAVFHRLERVVYPFIVAFQTLPKIAIAPLIIIWLGFDGASKITIVAIVAFFPILVNTMQGMRLRERERFELMQSLGANSWQTFRYIRFPSALPYIFAGLHIGAIFALIGTVAAEFVGASEGLGVLLMQQKSLFNVPGVFSILVLFMVIGICIHVVMRFIERRVAFWAQEDKAMTAG